MGWSTSQLAELAGTTVRAVRHYHDVGLLAEPERRANGYKSYGVAHLVRVLRIKRLIGLGLSLAQIADLGDADEHPKEALRVLDGELAATIERLRRIRAELAVILSQAVPTDLPPRLADLIGGTDLTAADRSMVVVMAQVFPPKVAEAIAERMRAGAGDPVTADFDNLPPDADEQTRIDVAERMKAFVAKLFADMPMDAETWADAPHGPRFMQRAVDHATLDLYNPAQIDVIRRCGN
ncbi:MerR family transcriptional regulator [Kutzneria sp. CA-103260]|uniref:MerR family transcriptional regulator n=1 Tax=Kutzneria sp. CA-103260 TaxID=2802641 RepID=UPI001BAAAD61|nr:MerR family transcriptional regulator [Kutzneria sp. CA-103260]QUQ71924.1 HTH-type transcriptional activator TipA [Kutzneria sp. CA-103260]